MTLGEVFNRHRKPIALGLLGAALFALSALVVVPVVASTIDARGAIEAERERLATLRARRADLAELEAALQDLRARQAGRPLVIEAPSATAAFDKLEAAIRDLSSRAQAAINSTRMLRLEDEAGLKAVRAEIDLTVGRPELSQFIASLEAAAPMLFVERLRLADEDRSDREARVRVTASLRALAAVVPVTPAVAKR